MTKRSIGLKHWLVLNSALNGSDQRWDLRQETLGLAHLCVRRVGLALGIVMSKDAHARAQETHWVRSRRSLDHRSKLIDHRLLNGAHALHFIAERCKLRVGWLGANQNEVRNSFKGGLLGEVSDLVAAIDEFGLRDSADLGFANHLVGESTRVDRLCGWDRGSRSGGDHGF